MLSLAFVKGDQGDGRFRSGDKCLYILLNTKHGQQVGGGVGAGEVVDIRVREGVCVQICGNDVIVESLGRRGALLDSCQQLCR